MNRHVALLRAIRSQIKKDLTQERKEIVAVALETRPLLGFFYRILGFPFFREIGSILFSIRSLLLWAGHSADAKGMLVLRATVNERRALKEILNGRSASTFSALEWVRDIGFPLPILFKEGLKFFRIVRRLSEAKPLYFRVRLIELLIIYFLQSRKIKAIKSILVASEGNPHGLALLALGKRHSLPTVFASHAPISVNPIAIDCDCAILSGIESELSFRKAGSKMGKIEFHSLPHKIFSRGEKDIFALKEICLCLGMGFNIRGVEELLEHLAQHLPGLKVKVRAHPSLPSAARALNSKVNVSIGKTFAEDFSPGTLALAGNSTVHLDLWVRGIPSLYWPHLDRGADQLLPFVVANEIPRLESLEGLVKWNSIPWGALRGDGMDELLRRYYSGEKEKRNGFRCLDGL